MFDQSLFGETITIPDSAQVVFVSDFFVEDYVGGAELTTQALIESSPYSVFKLHSKDVTLEHLRQGQSKFWVFANFSMMNGNLIPTVVANMKYSVLEYDYKYCRYRSPEKHLEVEKTPCNCDQEMSGKLVSSFYFGAESVFWMSEKQKEKYMSCFPFLTEKENIVLSSVFDEKFFQLVHQLQEKHRNVTKSKWVILGSDSWIKGFEAAKKHCENNSLEYESVWNLPYEKVLEKLATAEGLVYLPNGSDTCPRLTIEAKLLGCKLRLNDYVQHSQEEWFSTDDLSKTEEYLVSRKDVFWTNIRRKIEAKSSISGYTTTYNCISQKYPFEQSIQSLLGFCDEVVVVDGGSTDGTWMKLVELTEHEPRLKIKMVSHDWTHPRFAVFDGMQKAEARKLCTKDFCWQQDSDEIVHENDYEKIRDLVGKFPKGVNLISLPVVEYWGGYDKVRLDVNPWKWRLSRNIPSITHGIPTSHRRVDSVGNTYALPGTDGCDMIDSQTGESVQFLGFYTEEAHKCRSAALTGNTVALLEYQRWFNSVISALPGVYHFSWFDIERKIHTYKNYWSSHWQSLHNEKVSDTAENNMFFDLPWSEVTDEMILEKAKELSEKTGGHIFHTKWKGQKTPWMVINQSLPEVAKKLYT